MAKVDVLIPSLGESVTQARLSKWLKADGDVVQRDEPLCELETDKANVDMPSPAAGRLSHKKAEGDTLNVGEVVAVVDTEASASAAAPAAKPAAPKPVAEPEAKPKAAPAPMPVSHAPAPVTVAPRTIVDIPGVRRVPMTRIRKTIADRLLAAKHDTAMLTTFNEIDMTAVEHIRESNQEAFQKAHGVKLGMLSFFAKAVSAAAKEFPVINAAIDGDDVLYFDDVNLGVAVSTERGLVVPIVRAVNKMSLAQIETDIKRVATAARAGKLGFAELSGGSFTITNGGVFGSLLSTPILNPPQSAILGLHATQRRPVAVGEKGKERVEIRPMMYVALSYDHRLIDGKESVSFLVRVKQLMEDPARFVLEG